MSNRNYATTRNKLTYGKDYIFNDHVTAVNGQDFIFSNITQALPEWRSKVNPWELKFITSCIKFSKLSDKQQGIVLKIKDKYTRKFK